MTTARTICGDALRLVGITQVGEDPSNEDISAALDYLNLMMRGLAAKGSTSPWADLKLGDTVPLDDEMDETLIYALGRRLITPLGASQPDPDLMQDMRDAARRLEARFFTSERVKLDGFTSFSRHRRMIQ